MSSRSSLQLRILNSNHAFGRDGECLLGLARGALKISEIKRESEKEAKAGVAPFLREVDTPFHPSFFAKISCEDRP